MVKPARKARLAVGILWLCRWACRCRRLRMGLDAAGTGSGANFYIGTSSFPRGDAIEITSVERSSDRLVVRGHYKLVSADRAQLSLYTTTSEAVSRAPTDRTQLKDIYKGAG